jgi:hypothetical protein
MKVGEMYCSNPKEDNRMRLEAPAKKSKGKVVIMPAEMRIKFKYMLLSKISPVWLGSKKRK